MVSHLVEITVNNKKIKTLCYEHEGVIYYGNIKKDDYHGDVRVIRKVDVEN